MTFKSSGKKIKVRGSNFKNFSTLFTDETNNYWLLKKLNFRALLNEYIVSILAQELNIPVPRSIIIKNDYSFALMQEFVENNDELMANLHFKAKEEDIIQLMIFESWIAAVDRHAGNYLIADNKLWAIDFKECFSESVDGTELPIFLPWMQDVLLNKSVALFKSKITQARILEIKEEVLNLSELLTDTRAQENIVRTIIEIFELLIDNFSKLEYKANQYLNSRNNSNDIFLQM